jgi:putative nucleotidyltransferase with HDIG domain
MNIEQVKKVLDEIKEIQTLPAIAMRINRMVDSPHTTPEMLCKVIEKDQAIVTKLLRLVNSSFYGMPSRVSSISDAVVLLGYNTLRNIVLTVSVMGAFSSSKKNREINPAEFWKHSLAVSSVSKYISEITGIGSPDDCFTGGLLHDLGKIVMFLEFNDLFKVVVDSATENNIAFCMAEKKLGVASHADIGSYLARKWKVPVVLCDAIKYHHNFASYRKKGPALVIHIANAIVHCYMKDNILNKKPAGKEAFKIVEPQYIRMMKPVIEGSVKWFPEIFSQIEESLKGFA